MDLLLPVAPIPVLLEQDPPIIRAGDLFVALFKQSADHYPYIQVVVDQRDHPSIIYCFRQDLDEFAVVHRVQIHIHNEMIPAGRYWLS